MRDQVTIVAPVAFTAEPVAIIRQLTDYYAHAERGEIPDKEMGAARALLTEMKRHYIPRRDICERCNGTGWETFGAHESSCGRCGGGGRRPKGTKT